MSQHRTNSIGRVWRYSFVLTLPLFIFSLLWLPASWDDIDSFVLRHPSTDDDIRLDSELILKKRLRFLVEQMRLTVLTAFNPTRQSHLPTYNLEIAPEYLAQIKSRLPVSGREWVPAKITMPNELSYEAKTRLRGDSFHHWGLDSKSWRVRFKKKRIVAEERRMDFIVPRRLGDGSYYLPLRMAQELGLLAPALEFVQFRVNGRSMGGVHYRLETVDEGFLRRHNRLPGDIFLGDMVLGDAFPREQGIGPSMWALPKGWTKAAYDNKFPKNSDAPLFQFLVALARSGSAEGHGKLRQLIDLDAWARLAAWLKLTGSSHFDYGHNWVLYFDEGRQVIEPIVRDGNGLADNLADIAKAPGADIGATSPIMVQLHFDHEFLRLKAKAIAEFLTAGKDRELRKELERVAGNVAGALDISAQLSRAVSHEGRSELSYMDGETFRTEFAKHNRLLDGWFEKQRDVSKLARSNLDVAVLSSDTVRLRVAGYAAVSELEIPLSEHTSPLSVCLRYRVRGGSEKCEPVDRYVSVWGPVMRFRLPLLAGRKLNGIQRSGWVVYRKVESVPATYDLVIKGARIRSEARNRRQGFCWRKYRHCSRCGVAPGTAADRYARRCPRGPAAHHLVRRYGNSPKPRYSG